MSFANPAALWALTLAIPIIALHILRSRRIEVQVSSTLAWEEVNRPVAAARPWQRLRTSIPLLLQLLLATLLALALAGPSFDSGHRSAKHLVVILDTSSSMAATDGSPTRLADAKKVVEDLADGLGDGAVITVISGGAPARVVASGVSPSSISSRLGSVEASEGPFDSEAAFIAGARDGQRHKFGRLCAGQRWRPGWIRCAAPAPRDFVPSRWQA